MVMDFVHMYFLGCLCLVFLLVALLEFTRRREGIVARGRCMVLGDLAYAACCCPCAMSWIMRVERGASLGHARKWSLLSPVGADESAEVLPIDSS